MASEVQICNLALARVGVSKAIQALDEKSSLNASICNLFYESMRDAVLEDFPWPFASKYRTLALLAKDPNTDWAYVYRLPTDCLRPRKIAVAGRQQDNLSPIAFELGSDDSGLVLYTDEAEAVLKYTMRFTDPTYFAPSFVSALAWRIGSEIGLPLARQQSWVDRCMKLYQAEISTARANAANAGQPDEPPDAEIIRARL